MREGYGIRTRSRNASIPTKQRTTMSGAITNRQSTTEHKQRKGASNGRPSNSSEQKLIMIIVMAER